jgi:hypothetical protein
VCREIRFSVASLADGSRLCRVAIAPGAVSVRLNSVTATDFEFNATGVDCGGLPPCVPRLPFPCLPLPFTSCFTDPQCPFSLHRVLRLPSRSLTRLRSLIVLDGWLLCSQVVLHGSPVVLARQLRLQPGGSAVDRTAGVAVPAVRQLQHQPALCVPTANFPLCFPQLSACPRHPSIALTPLLSCSDYLEFRASNAKGLGPITQLVACPCTLSSPPVCMGPHPPHLSLVCCLSAASAQPPAVSNLAHSYPPQLGGQVQFTWCARPTESVVVSSDFPTRSDHDRGFCSCCPGTGTAVRAPTTKSLPCASRAGMQALLLPPLAFTPPRFLFL